MIAKPTTSLDASRRRIEARLEELLPQASGQDIVRGAMEASVLASGKRLRPLMTAIVAEDLGGSLSAAIDVGCAIEMVHAASLILDDLPCMDDALLRRGRPALHLSHGEDVAVLAAVALLSHAYGVIAARTDIEAGARLDCISALATAVGLSGLVGGQFQDLHEGRRDRVVTEIVEANARKTGALFRAAIDCGALVAGARSERETLGRLADELGAGFQLLDDLLDTAPDAAFSGKNPGQDAGKSTLVALIGQAPVERRIERHLDTAHMHLAAVFGPGSRLGSLVDGVFRRDGGAAGASRAANLEREAGVR